MKLKGIEYFIVREFKYDFDFIGPTLTMLAYDSDEKLIDYVVLEENK